MIREKSYLLINLNKVLDVWLTSVAFYLSILIQGYLPFGYGNYGVQQNHLLFLILILFTWYIVFNWNTAYKSYRKKKFLDIFGNLVKSCFISSVVLVVSLYFLREENLSRSLLITFLLIDVIILAISKFVIFCLFARISDDTHDTSHIIIVGTRDRASEIINKIINSHDSGQKILGCLGIDESEIGKVVQDEIKVIGLIQDLAHYLTEKVVDEVIFAIPLKLIKDADKYFAIAEDMGVSVRIIPDWQLYYLMYEPDIATIKFENFMQTPTMLLQVTTPNEGALLIKSGLDYLMGAILLILFLPFFVFTGIFIKSFSKGPVFFKQDRLGLHGRVFQVYKFRTMVENAEQLKEVLKLDTLNEAEGPVFKIKNDPRIVPYIGTFLRKTNLDELPQIINVIRGEMSLVGPRPPIPSEVKEYEIWQRRRLSMKPGITCLWQIAPARNDILFEEWMKLDLKYIDNWSLWLDFKIFVLTARTVILGTGR